MRKVCLFSLMAIFSASVFAQQLKSKEVKKFLEAGVSEISIITNDLFTPELSQEMDMKVTFTNGQSVLASDYHFIWDESECTVANAGWKIKGELLANGKGLIVPYILSMYPPGKENTVTISMALSGKKASKVLTPDYCIKDYRIVRKGSNGLDGSDGYDGRSGGGDGADGKKGTDGKPGPDISVQIEEENISSKTYVVITIEDQKYMLDPECSNIQIISQGGNGGDGGRAGDGGDSAKDSKYEYTGSGGRGGSGGDGGNGGNGGTITVSGSAFEKHKSKFTFLSNVGKEGDGGSAGSGGKGKYSGRSGLSGSDGRLGQSGQVVFK